MSPETIERAFEPFFTTKSDGTGLGLATVYGIVTGAGGRIDVYSEPGMGTTVKIHLPDHGRAAGEYAADDAADVSGRGEVVLVVEDEPDVRRMAERILATGGYSVIGTLGGRPRRWRSAPGRRQQLDLLLTDVIMPEMLGTELVEKVRIDPPGPAVVYMSGYSHAVLAPEALTEDGAAPSSRSLSARRTCRTIVRELLDRPGGAEGEDRWRLRRPRGEDGRAARPRRPTTGHEVLRLVDRSLGERYECRFAGERRRGAGEARWEPSFDLALCDIQMPGESGLVLAEEIAARVPRDGGGPGHRSRRSRGRREGL